MANGVNTDNIDPVAISDEVLVNRDGSTGRQKTVDLATQLAGTGAVADKIAGLETSGQQLSVTADDHETRLSSVEATQTTNMVYAAAWAGDLADIVPAYIGQGAEIVDEAGGSHTDPLLEATVPDAGRYKSYGTAVGAWTRISSTGLGEKASTATLRTAGVYHCTAVQDGVDPNLVLLTNPDVPAAPTEGMRITFIAPFTNTGNLKLKINGGAVLDVTQLNNGAVFAGAITEFYPYEFTFFGAPSNKYKLTTVLQSTGEIRDGLVAKPDTFGGTANALTVTLRQAAVDRQLLLIKPTANNTGPATINVKSAADVASGGAGTTTGIVNMDGTPITADTLVVGRFTLLMRDASGGNPWRILADGANQAQIDAILADMSGLDGRITSLESASGVGEWENEAKALMDKINGPNVLDAAWEESDRNPDHVDTGAGTRISWDQGVRTEAAPAVIKILGGGSSWDVNGAGSADAAEYTPTLILKDKLSKRFSVFRNLDFTTENVAVNGEGIDTFLAQITSAPAGSYDIIFGFNFMNSGGVSAIAGAGTMRPVADKLDALITEIRGVNRNAMPYFTLTAHPHIAYDISGGLAPQTFLDTYKVAWPRGNTTYQVNSTHEFDAAGSRIKLVNISLYGNTLADGDTLYVPPGDGGGTYTIATGGIDWATNWVTVNEVVTYTGTRIVQVTNRAADEERVVWPPQSKRIGIFDRTGNGIELPGFITFDELNRTGLDVCQRRGVGVLDVQHRQFLFLERQKEANPSITDSDLYDTMYVQGGVRQANHPNAPFWDFAYDYGLARLAHHIYARDLDKNRVIR